MQVKKQLIVEGYFDKMFMDSLLKSSGIKDVDVKMPQAIGTQYGGKGNAINVFASALNLLNDGSLEKIALVIDADFVDISSQGFRNTLQTIKDKTSVKGFNIKTQPVNYRNGIYFKKDSLDVDVAIWIMPDNHLDGYIEYLLFEALKTTKTSIICEMEGIISGMKNKEYPKHHEMKAKLAIAMAMLENPGRNITHLVEKDILNHNHNPVLKNFINFLEYYFKK
jgi:hypothetical protein